MQQWRAYSIADDTLVEIGTFEAPIEKVIKQSRQRWPMSYALDSLRIAEVGSVVDSYVQVQLAVSKWVAGSLRSKRREISRTIDRNLN